MIALASPDPFTPKELRDVEIDSDSDKLKIQEYFADKYTGTGKFIKKINNLLSR
ncbi:MAG: hypothetical protein U9R27_11105 [Campylobacterota bacterium]|nr:hypothetical protein [Campylobacterota bacterium]